MQLAKPRATLLAAAACVAFVAAAQDTLYVTPSGSGTGDGSSWADAASDLRVVMSGALPGSEIWVAQGTYTPTDCAPCGLGDRKVSFQLREGITVIGGFVGNESSAEDANPANVTTLSGDIDADGLLDANSFSVVECAKCGDQAELRNIVIREGNANAIDNSLARERSGGGLYIDGTFGVASPTLRNCSFFNNHVRERGGAVAASAFRGEVSPQFTNCLFANNESNNDGGAVLLSVLDASANPSTPSFDECRFNNNRTVYEPTLSGGTSGGAIYVTSDAAARMDIAITRTLFAENQADEATSSGNGGGLYLQTQNNVTVTIENAIFNGNTSYAGAAVYSNKATLIARNVTVVNNRALGSGGSGGGIYTNGGQSDIVNSIIYANDAPNPAGGQKSLRLVNGLVNVSYTLIEAVDCAQLQEQSSNSQSSTLNCGPGLIFGQAVDFPGLTFAGFIPELSNTSPALNAGLNSEVTSAFDYVGGDRIVADTVDLGAVENAQGPLPIELLSFSATAGESDVHVDWLTASEVNFEGYSLQRSTDGISFEEIAFVPAMDKGEYSFRDRAVAGGGTYYYRLAGRDLDGTTYDSDVIVATVEAAVEQLIATRVFPNPTAGTITLEIEPREGARTVYAAVVDQSGRRVLLMPITEDGRFQLDLRDLPDGNYVLRLTEGDRAQTSLISVKH